MSFLKNILGLLLNSKKSQKEKEVIPDAQNKGPEITTASQKVNAQEPSGQQVQQAGFDTSISIAPANVPSQYQKHFQDLIDEANHKNPLFSGN